MYRISILLVQTVKQMLLWIYRFLPSIYLLYRCIVLSEIKTFFINSKSMFLICLIYLEFSEYMLPEQKSGVAALIGI